MFYNFVKIIIFRKAYIQLLFLKTKKRGQLPCTNTAKVCEKQLQHLRNNALESFEAIFKESLRLCVRLDCFAIPLAAASQSRLNQKSPHYLSELQAPITNLLFAFSPINLRFEVPSKSLVRPLVGFNNRRATFAGFMYLLMF